MTLVLPLLVLDLGFACLGVSCGVGFRSDLGLHGLLDVLDVFEVLDVHASGSDLQLALLSLASGLEVRVCIERVCRSELGSHDVLDVLDVIDVFDVLASDSDPQSARLSLFPSDVDVLVRLEGVRRDGVSACLLLPSAWS